MTSPTIIAPTISGPQAIDVDGRLFGIPQGSQLIWRRHSSRSLVYVMLPDRAVHALIAEGEVVLDEATAEEARQRFLTRERS